MTMFGIKPHRWNGDFNEVNGWLCSRKLNGWSALWDGGITAGMPCSEIPWTSDKGISTGLWTFGNTSGAKVIHAPKEFTNKLPKLVPLHGELWHDDDLSYIKSVCGSHKSDPRLWAEVKFITHNVKPYCLWVGLPSSLISIAEQTEWYFKQNYVDARTLLWKTIDRSLLNEITIIESEEDLNVVLRRRKEGAWEGLVFHSLRGEYTCDRSWSLLKYKPDEESEAEVVGYEEGKTGKNIGYTGAIRCQKTWDNSVESFVGGKKQFVGKTVYFSVSGLTYEENREAEQMYPIGSTIRIKFNGLTNYGIPQHCTIYRGM
jgi:hypothetical protein